MTSNYCAESIIQAHILSSLTNKWWRNKYRGKISRVCGIIKWRSYKKIKGKLSEPGQIDSTESSIGLFHICLCSGFTLAGHLPSPLTWVSPGLFPSYFLTPLSQILLCWIFYLSLNKLWQRCHQCHSSGRTLLEPPGAASVWHGGSSWCHLTEATPANSLNKKTWPC